MVETNYLAVAVAALVYFGGGALWYSTALFGKPWMTALALDPEKMEARLKEVWKSYLTSLFSALLISYGLARLVGYMSVDSVMGGILTGFWSWLCFVFTTTAINNSFANRPLRLLLIDTGYHLYGFLVMSIILAVWK